MVFYNVCRGRVVRIAVEIMALAIIVLAGGADAATITVNDNGGADFAKIQDAINASTAGDTILVYSGTYYENVNVTKQLILRGIDNGGGKPVVDSGMKGSAIVIKVSEVTLDGFNPRNSSVGIYVNSNNNTIVNNNASNGAEIKLLNSNNNILIGNLASYNSFGIYLEDSDNNTISGNTANWNSYSGIHLVYSNNNTLNGNSFSINKEYGIYIGGSNHNTLIDNYAYSSYGKIWKQTAPGVWRQYNIGKGIYLHSSSKNTLKDNNANFNNLYGIFFEKSDNNTLIGNNASSNEKIGIFLRDSDNNKMNGNNFTGSSLLGDTGIDLSDSYNITLSYNNVSHFDTGIILRSSSNNLLIGNKAKTNDEGIVLSFSNNSRLMGNDASNNFDGIVLTFSSNNTLSGNYVSNNNRGIFQQSSSNNLLSGNIVNLNNYGIYLGYCHLCLYSALYSTHYSDYTPSNNNTLNGNIVSNNNYGIYLKSFDQDYSSSNNRIYHNNILSNINQSYDNSSFNSWYSSYPSGGNYWSDYTGVDLKSGPNQDQSGSDGIGDTPYDIAGSIGAKDFYPFMEPLNLIDNEFDIQLSVGWNLISFPLIPKDTSVISVLSPISEDYSIVWEYNASDTTDHWKKHDLSAPFGNDLIDMESGKGYWILMTADDTLQITGTVPESTDINLKTGWNLIGYNSLDSQPITDALSSINGNYDIIWEYDATDTTDHWKKYDPSAPFGNDLANMEPGKGYWVMMTSDDILEI